MLLNSNRICIRQWISAKLWIELLDIKRFWCSQFSEEHFLMYAFLFISVLKACRVIIDELLRSFYEIKNHNFQKSTFWNSSLKPSMRLFSKELFSFFKFSFILFLLNTSHVYILVLIFMTQYANWVFCKPVFIWDWVGLM